MDGKGIRSRIVYSDKLDLIKKLLGIYNAVEAKHHLTPRAIELLTFCFIFDVNDKDFKQNVMDTGLNINTPENVLTMMSRLKRDGFLIQDPVKNKKYLNPSLTRLKELVDGSDNVGIQLMFQKNT